MGHESWIRRVRHFRVGPRKSASRRRGVEIAHQHMQVHDNYNRVVERAHSPSEAWKQLRSSNQAEGLSEQRRPQREMRTMKMEQWEDPNHFPFSSMGECQWEKCTRDGDS